MSYKILKDNIPAGNYVFKVNNKKTRARGEMCSKLKIKAPERRHWRRLNKKKKIKKRFLKRLYCVFCNLQCSISLSISRLENLMSFLKSDKIPLIRW